MIQRVQTVYLLLAAALLGLFLSAADGWLAGATSAFEGLLTALYVLGGLTLAVALLAVFLYKQRAAQGKVILAAQGLDLLLVLSLAVTLGLFHFGLGADLAGTPTGALAGAGGGAWAASLAALLLPVVAYVALQLARRGVRKDIDLVRSMDRLR